MRSLSRPERRRIPSHHYSLVGPLWVELEQALFESGATGASAEARIRSIEARLGPQGVRRLHYVRMQRNQLMHAPPRPLDDAREWEQACRQSIDLLRAITRTRHRAGRARLRRRPSVVANASSRPWQVVAVGILAAAAVLSGARYIELICTALMAWLIWALFTQH